MKHKKFGFTLIEVSLFLAVTGALFVAIIIGTRNAIWQQKYNDSVQNYANFLRSVYAQVSNPQSLGEGRTGQAIYGKLITFGQKYNLTGGLVANDNREQEIFVYDVVGDAEAEVTGSINRLLSDLNVSLVVSEKLEDNTTVVDFAGYTESYTPTWGAVIDDPDGTLFKGAILIVRHPRSGVVNTLVNANVMEVNEVMANAREYGDYTTITGMLKNALKTTDEEQGIGFFVRQVDFCVNPYGAGVQSGLRRDIRLISNARNASGVEIVDLVEDPNENKCVR